jgi:predicted Zn-dependent protease
MKSREQLHEIADSALHAVEADQIEVGIDVDEIGVTRFANSVIHQSIARETEQFWGRVILGKRIGGISVVSLAKERTAEGMAAARELAEHQKDDPEFVSLPKAKGIEQLDQVGPVTPEERARCVQSIVDVASKNGLTAAGVIYTIGTALQIMNSQGVDSFGKTAYSHVDVTLMTENSSGYATHTGKDFSEVDGRALAETASEKALLSVNPEEVPPGKYLTLLEPPAVAELLVFLNYIGFGARSFQEGRSFMSGKIGQKVTGENITIVDDASNPNGLGLRFDAEGVPTQKVDLIDKGVARNVVYDSYYAHKEGRESTGHAIVQPNPFGPYARNLSFLPGESSRDEMLASIDRGILITRLWYTRLVDPDKTLVTGMTRDGTFLVEDGKISKGIKNMRYTANILETFANAIMISKTQKLQWFGGSLVPALLVQDFNFTGKTEY